MRFLKYAFILLFFILISCSDNSNDIKRVQLIYSILKVEYAPNNQTELFDINFDTTKDKLILTGEVTNLSPYFKLKNTLTRKNLKYKNKVRVLPDSAVGNKWFAVVKNSVIDTRKQPSSSSDLVNQALLGMPLKVIDKKGDFYRVQTPDRYFSWVAKDDIIGMNKVDFTEWNQSEKIIFIKTNGFVYNDKNFKETVSEITSGSILKLVSNHEKYYEVEYPDKKKGFLLKNEAFPYDIWLKNLASNDLMKGRQHNIETVAKSFLESPYLFNGASTKGMDASGFVKMVYLMNGFIIPKNIDQQIKIGKTVAINLDFSELDKGDLIFFGEKAAEETKENATHVGIWLGNNKQEFIHVSENIRISSMDENQPNYDPLNKNSYLKGKRYLGVNHDEIFDLKNYSIGKKNIRRYGPLYINRSNKIF
jgi:SH3-like domain-containing protein